MPQTKDAHRRRTHALFLVLVSIFGLAISANLLGVHATTLCDQGDRRMIAASLYAAVCLAGMLAVLCPATCSRAFGVRRSPTVDSADLQVRATRLLGVYVVHGHHELASEARSHELRLFGKSFCASCFGLFAGAAISLTAVTIFAVSGYACSAGKSVAYLLYLAGASGVLLGLVQALIFNPGPRVRFALATVFVLGTGLMLISTDMLTSSLEADLFVVLLAAFWAVSRMSMQSEEYV